jgi:hypothetical protein
MLEAVLSTQSTPRAYKWTPQWTVLVKANSNLTEADVGTQSTILQMKLAVASQFSSVRELETEGSTS